MPQLRNDLNDFDSSMQVGDWCFTSDDLYIIIRLHDGEDGVAAIRIQHDDEIPNGIFWQWDGNREAPTLSPSIWHHSKPEWHGWMRAGKLETA